MAQIIDYTQDRLNLGKHLVENYIGKDALAFPPGEAPYQARATEWLELIGFERVEWMINDNGDILLLLLWYTDLDGKVKEFILEFSGYDAQIVSVFELSTSVQL